MRTMRIDEIIKSVDKLPSFPLTVFKVGELLRTDDYSASDIVDLIKYDQAIAANIVKMSNSPYFGARQRIGSLRDAVVFLGRENLLRIVQTAGVSRFFKKEGRGYVEKAREIWEHSVAVALMSQILSRKIFKKEDGKLYLSALLHDVGKMVMGELVYDSFAEISKLVSGGGYSFLEAEKEIIGIDHAELGGKIAEKWNFPRDVVDAISFHHRPDLLEGAENMMAWLVYLADQVCLISGYTGGFDGLAHRGINEIMEKFDFHERDLELGMIQLVEELKHAEEVLGIV
ncbi:MAG: HDOD domain-containing protein [Syntrophales bacterium]